MSERKERKSGGAWGRDLEGRSLLPGNSRCTFMPVNKDRRRLVQRGMMSGGLTAHRTCTFTTREAGR